MSEMSKVRKDFSKEKVAKTSHALEKINYGKDCKFCC